MGNRERLEQWNQNWEQYVHEVGESISDLGYDENTAKNQAMKYHSEMTDFLHKTRVRYKDLVSEHIVLATRPLLNVPEGIQQTVSTERRTLILRWWVAWKLTPIVCRC